MSDNRQEIKGRVMKFLAERLEDSDFAQLNNIIENGGATVAADRGFRFPIPTIISDFDRRYPNASKIKLGEVGG